MSTQNLIKELSQKMQPVKSLPSPWVRASLWLFSTFLCIGSSVFLLGLRHDINQIIFSANFLFQTFIIILLAAFSVVGAFFLSIPGKPKTWVNVSFLFPLGILIFALLGQVGWNIYQSGSAPVLGQGYYCSRDVLVLGIIPGLLLTLMVKKAAPINFGLVGVLIFLATFSLAALGVNLICHGTDPFHLLIWHITPVILIGGIGRLLGRFFLKW